MKTCLSFDEILAFGKPEVEALAAAGRELAARVGHEACDAFSRHVGLVDAMLRHTYRIAASLARRASGAADAAEIWKEMGGFCNEVIGVLAELKNRYPQCGTPELYDRALDYKLACDRRYNDT